MLALHFVLAAALLAVAVYAHYRLAHHIKGKRALMVVRAVLAAVGLAFGYVAAAYASQASSAAVAFVQGFGVVHIPAAFILFLKRARNRV